MQQRNMKLEYDSHNASPIEQTDLGKSGDTAFRVTIARHTLRGNGISLFIYTDAIRLAGN